MDEQYMSYSLELAMKAEGQTSPNPLVGAIIVKGDAIIGKGYHQKAGTPHAEIHALAEAGQAARDSTLYVTLEPCVHHGRTPPCTEAIIQAGVKRVVAAMVDPNPLVAGKGLKRLQEAGIETAVGVLQANAHKINEAFIKWIKSGKPFVVLKTASSLDGKIATVSGQSKWITNSQSRELVHSLRNRYDAIMVGIGTVLIDNPLLTTRLHAKPGKNPIRIIIDSKARIPLTANVIVDKSAPTILVVSEQAPEDKINALLKLGIEVIVTPTQQDNKVDLPTAFHTLATKNITSVLVEGGHTLNWSIVSQGIADKGYAFLAPKIIGGQFAPGAIGGTGFAEMSALQTIEISEINRLGDDILIEYYFKSRDGGLCLQE